MEQEIGGWIIVAFAFLAGGWLGYYNHDRIDWFLDKIRNWHPGLHEETEDDFWDVVNHGPMEN